MTIYALACLLKENAADPFTSEKNAAHPAVVTEEPFKIQPCGVTVEGATYVVQDKITALATLYELYWVFNLQYAPALARTLSIVEHFFGVSGNKKHGVLVSRIISDIRALARSNNGKDAAQ